MRKVDERAVEPAQAESGCKESHWHKRSLTNKGKVAARQNPVFHWVSHSLQNSLINIYNDRHKGLRCLRY